MVKEGGFMILSTLWKVMFKSFKSDQNGKNHLSAQGFARRCKPLRVGEGVSRLPQFVLEGVGSYALLD